MIPTISNEFNISIYVVEFVVITLSFTRNLFKSISITRFFFFFGTAFTGKKLFLNEILYGIVHRGEFELVCRTYVKSSRFENGQLIFRLRNQPI